MCKEARKGMLRISDTQQALQAAYNAAVELQRWEPSMWLKFISAEAVPLVQNPAKFKQ